LASEKLVGEELVSKELVNKELVSKELAEGGLMNEELIHKPLDTTHFKNDEWNKTTEFHDNLLNDDYDIGYKVCSQCKKARENIKSQNRPRIVAVKSFHDSVSEDLEFLNE
ncbi:310_t:CDS:2, partial [Racocetra fulgida]